MGSIAPTAALPLGRHPALKWGLWAEPAQRWNAPSKADQVILAAMTTTACPRCGRSFDCGATDSSKPCWCVSLPALPLEQLGKDDAGCYCPDCLRLRLAEPTRPGPGAP